MIKTKCYILSRCEGEYEDYYEHVEGIYISKSQAEKAKVELERIEKYEQQCRGCDLSEYDEDCEDLSDATEYANDMLKGCKNTPCVTINDEFVVTCHNRVVPPYDHANFIIEESNLYLEDK